MSREFSHHAWVEFMFGGLDAGMKCFRRVAGKHRNAALAEDRPGIDSGIDEVDRATRLRYPGVQGLSPCLKPAEGREEGGVDVQNPSRECLEKGLLDDPHEAGEHNEIDARLKEEPHHLLFGLWRHLRAEGSRGNKVCRNPEASGKIKNACGFDIREDDCGNATDGPFAPRLGQGVKIGSLARTQNAESET